MGEKQPIPQIFGQAIFPSLFSWGFPGKVSPGLPGSRVEKNCVFPFNGSPFGRVLGVPKGGLGINKGPGMGATWKAKIPWGLPFINGPGIGYFPGPKIAAGPIPGVKNFLKPGGVYTGGRGMDLFWAFGTPDFKWPHPGVPKPFGARSAPSAGEKKATTLCGGPFRSNSRF